MPFRWTPLPIAIIAIHKAASAIICFLAISIGPFAEIQYENIVHWPEDRCIRLVTWDSAYYLLLSEHGYAKGEASCAFYPALPLILSFLPKDPALRILTGLVVCNLISACGLLLLYEISKDVLKDVAGARWALILILCYPGSLFLNLIYTEGLFLLSSTLFIWATLHKRTALVILAAFLLPLTKAVGFFAVLGFVLCSITSREQRNILVAAMIGAVLGYSSYFSSMWLATGNPFEGFDAQLPFPTSPSIANALDIRGMAEAFFCRLRLHGMTDSFLDRAMFLFFLVSVPGLLAFNSRLTAFFIPVAVLPAVAAWWISYVRNLSSCWILFIFVSSILRKNRPAFVSICVSFGLIQVWLLWRHVNYFWAG